MLNLIIKLGYTLPNKYLRVLILWTKIRVNRLLFNIDLWFIYWANKLF